MKRPSLHTEHHPHRHPVSKAAFALITCFLCLSPTLLPAQELTSLGTDFWVAMMENTTPLNNQYYLSATAPRTCSVTITNPRSHWSHTMTVAAGSVTTYELPRTECWASGSCIISNKGLHITATDTIQLWAYNRNLPTSCDATQVLPFQSLGPEYIIQTALVEDCYLEYSRAQFSVLATEDSTIVDIVFSGATSTGIAAGSTITQMLHAGQIYQVQSPTQNGDYSGTTVTARDCKPIAVFSGANVVNIPIAENNSADHVYQQNLPVGTYSTEWILTPSAWHDSSDYVRVTSGADNCQISYNGAALSTINYGETYEFELTSAGCITTSQPAALYQYLSSHHGGVVGSDWGDAAMFAPNPIHQRSKSCTFPCYTVFSHDPYVSKYYVDIIVPTSEASLVLLDGSTVAGFSGVPGTGFSYARVPITETLHTLTTTGSGFIAHTYGLGENWEGYVMSLGGTDPYRHALAQDTAEIDTFACDTTFQWRGRTLTAPSTDTVGNCDTTFILHIALSPSYSDTIDSACCSRTIVMGDTTLTIPDSFAVHYNTVAGCDSTVLINFVLLEGNDTNISVGSCNDQYQWQNSTYAVPGKYDIWYTDAEGCDSIVLLDITLLQGSDTTLYLGSCDDQLVWQDTTYRVPGNYDIYLTNAEGCDSIIHLLLSQYPSYEVHDTIYIEGANPYLAPDGQSYPPGSHWADTLLTVDGCDSIRHIAVVSTASSSKIWVPNVFTPNKNTNNLFRVVSEEVTKMTVTIYQRQGDWICTFDGLTEGWDGTKNGKPCKEGTYVYFIRYETPELATPKPIVGTVTLLK